MHLPPHITALLLAAAALLPVAIGLATAPKLTKELLRDLRIPRILHFVALAFLGVALQLNGAVATTALSMDTSHHPNPPSEASPSSKARTLSKASPSRASPIPSPISSGQAGQAGHKGNEGHEGKEAKAPRDSHLSSFIFHQISSTTSISKTSLAFLAFSLSLSLAALFAIVTNNLADVAADKISNPNRPTVRGTVAPKPYLIAGISCQIWALSIPWILPPHQALPITLAVAGISLGYFIYSCPPLRLKRVPILAKVIIGANSWVVALGGFALAGGKITDFPLAWTIFILGPLALAANFIDLKDVEGDRATGIATLPVLMGVQNARHLIAAATAATYIMGGILLNRSWAWPLNLIALATHLYLLYRPNSDERLIFLVYVGALFGLGGMLMWL